MNHPPPQFDPHLEHATPGASPGGLVQTSDRQTFPVPTPTQFVHLEISDELGPFPQFVGEWVPLVGDAPGDHAVTADGEQLFVLDVYLRAGVAHRQKCRTRHLPGAVTHQQATPNFINNIFEPEEDVGRGSRARADFIKLARSNELNLFVSLNYEDQPFERQRYPSACDEMFTLFLRRIRRRVDPFPWLEVLEYGDENYRLHHHALFPGSISHQLISEQWTYGTAVTILLSDIDAIGKTADYMSKHFEDPEQMRPRRNRYRPGKRLYREQPTRLIGTWEALEQKLRQLLPEGMDLDRWWSQHPYSAGGYSWNRPI